MDKQQRASDIVKLLYKYRKDKVANESNLIKAICSYFDDIKNKDLTNGDMFFLRYMASTIGIPQYFDMLNMFREQDAYTYDNLDDFSCAIADCSLYTSDDVFLHRYQKNILDMFEQNKCNRYFLSATTSFGKTYLVYEIIRKMDYNNILLIFPTLALLAENLEKIFTEKYRWIRDKYKIHTLSDVFSWNDNGNLMIYTPERYLSFLDKNPGKRFNFVFIDEAYKIDNDFLQDGEDRENERDTAYRIATHFALKDNSIDCLFAGPYLNISERVDSSFTNFLNEYSIIPQNYNKYEIVTKKEINIGERKSIEVDGVKISLPFTAKTKRFTSLVRQLLYHKENMIVYCYSKASVEKYTKELIDCLNVNKEITLLCQPLLRHLEGLYSGKGKDWIVTKALKAGIGVHHGLIPKYIQNEIIKLFNNGVLKVIIATTTITEGVNTCAKNMIVLSHKKGNKTLKKFDAQNIEGRAGRFLSHYSGRVFILDSDFCKVLQGEENTINHRHFDKNINKGAIEVDLVKDQFLNIEDRRQKERNAAFRNNIQIPELLDLSFKTISIEDKYYVYSTIERLPQQNLLQIEQLIKQYNSRRICANNGIQQICDIVRPIVKNSDLIFLIDKKSINNEHSVLTNLISLYLKNDFSASVYYYIRLGTKVDEAVRKVAQTTYNTMRYQVVKYFGLFNIAYKCFMAKKNSLAIEDVHGIDLLLHKLEYQSETIIGRLASDAGASPNVVNYYDLKGKNEREAAILYTKLDEYEKQNAEAIRKIVEREL